MRRNRRAFGSIVERKGIFYARWIERGKAKKKAIGPSRELAERFLGKKGAELDREEALGIRAVEVIRFEALLDRYEVLFAGQKSPVTAKREWEYLKGKALPFFRGMFMDKVLREDIEKFLNKRTEEDGIGAATRNRLLSVLSSFFRKAERLNHARSNPCAGIQRTREALREPPYLDLPAQENLVAMAAEPVRSAILFSLDTGLRAGELLRLDWRDADLSRRTVTVRVSKNKQPRRVPFTVRGFAALEAMRARREPGARTRVPDLIFGELRFDRATGEPRLSTDARNEWERTRRKAGFPGLRWHDMRHIYGTTMARAGVSLGDLQRMMGHLTPSMTLRYSSHAPANSSELARDRMEAFLAAQVRQAAAQ